MRHDRSTYPKFLVKATEDSWYYACRLRTGDVVFFNWAEIDGEFAYIYSGDDENIQAGSGSVPIDVNDGPDGEDWIGNNRGLQVRISDIVWITEVAS